MAHFLADLCHLRAPLIERMVRKWTPLLKELNALIYKAWKCMEYWKHMHEPDLEVEPWVVEPEKPRDRDLDLSDDPPTTSTTIAGLLGSMVVRRKKKVVQQVEYFFGEETDLVEEGKKEDKDTRTRKMHLYWAEEWFAHLTSLKKEVWTYLVRVPVLGYNSGKYDLPVIRTILFDLFGLNQGILHLGIFMV